jgi:hypothetical protein
MAFAPAQSPPVIDVHVHSTNTTPTLTLERMKRLNIRLVVVSALEADLPKWSGSVQRNQLLPGLVFPCDQGRAPITGRQCFSNGSDFPDVRWLRDELQAGRIKELGELEPEYLGLSPGDARLEPYWRLAEEFDVPVGIHMGPGPPGIAYDTGTFPAHSPNYRMAVGDPLLLEDVLLRHKRLRLYIMHAGWPRLESMIALLYMHPNVYVDLAALQSENVIPRAEYYSYLHALVRSGFSKRIMFGSDFPEQAAIGIEAIQRADFLTPEQKNDILCGNAARFFRIEESVCKP